jgi:rRNA maturation endonuclease Nob1
MMLKCGQIDNKNYTFGVTEEQIKLNSIKKEQEEKEYCSSCGTLVASKLAFCPGCGEKIK